MTERLRAVDNGVPLDVPTYLGGTMALTATPVIGSPAHQYAEQYIPGEEVLDEREIRVVMLGTGSPLPTRVQAASSVLMEFGNGAVLLFDAGTGSIANFNALKRPMAEARTVFFSHLHVDHQGDFSMYWFQGAASGRSKPIEVYGPSGADETLGVASFVQHTLRANAWTTGSAHEDQFPRAMSVNTHEFDYSQVQVVYAQNDITVTAFPVIHGRVGAVGYRVEYKGLSVLYSGDTTPCQYVVDNGQQVDLLLHETLLPPQVLSQLTGAPLMFAEISTQTIHTTPQGAGRVLALTRPRMAALFHAFVTADTIGSIFENLRVSYQGPTTLTQDLTVFNITKEAVVARMTVPHLDSWPVMTFSEQGMLPMIEMETPINALDLPTWLVEAELQEDEKSEETQPVLQEETSLTEQTPLPAILEQMQARLSPAVRVQVNGVFSLELTGEDGGIYTIDARAQGSQGILNGSPSIYGLKPQATLIASIEDFRKVVSGEVSPPLAMMTGRIRVVGAMQTIRKLAPLLLPQSAR